MAPFFIVSYRLKFRKQMNNKYPILVRRYLGSVVDLAVVFGITMVMSRVIAANEFLSENTNPLVLLIPFLVYEPLLTSIKCTIGQWLFRFRVRNLDEKSKINLGQAVVRLIVKYVLGVISLLTIPARADRRAMHDLVTSSIVVNSNGG